MAGSSYILFLTVYYSLIAIQTVIFFISGWIIFSKAGEKGWKILIPVYNFVTLLRVVRRPLWWALCVYVPVVLVIACGAYYLIMSGVPIGMPVLGIFVGVLFLISSIFAIVYEIKALLALCDSFGVTRWFVLGLIFLPYLAGERSPVWDANAKGVFFGIDFSKTKAHFTRAVMEGVAYSLRHNLETAKEAGAEADILRVMGGSANSLLWTQIKADVTGRRLEVPSSDTATALGAAILAGVGTGVYSGFEDAAAKTVRITRAHEPDLSKREVYDKGYKIYRKLYENLKSLMSE